MTVVQTPPHDEQTPTYCRSQLAPMSLPFALALSPQEFVRLAGDAGATASASEWLGGSCGARTTKFDAGRLPHLVVSLDPHAPDCQLTVEERLVHEAVHVWQHSIKYYDLSPSDEEMAYGIQFVFAELHALLRNATEAKNRSTRTTVVGQRWRSLATDAAAVSERDINWT